MSNFRDSSSGESDPYADNSDDDPDYVVESVQPSIKWRISNNFKGNKCNLTTTNTQEES